MQPDNIIKMIKIPLPPKTNVTIVMSDGTGYISCEISMEELFENCNDITIVLDYLKAELIGVDRPNVRLAQAMDGVVTFRNTTTEGDH
jgi:hypothetical protein